MIKKLFIIVVAIINLIVPNENIFGADIDIKLTTINVEWCGNTVENIPSLYFRGRLYISARSLVSAFGASISVDADDNSIILIINGVNIKFNYTMRNGIYNMINYKNTDYVNAGVLGEKFNMVIEFNQLDNKVTYYSFRESESTFNKNITELKTGYIRLEDIAADGNDTVNNQLNFSSENLMKFRYIGKWLGEQKQKYYLSWIPIYVNPSNNYVNDLRYNNCLYNADFLYTLDYLIANGGNIGVHGLSHQYGNDKSAVGNEWGKDTPYSDSYQEERMIQALNIGKSLGFDIKFFEFPHYSVTQPQREMAEKYYDVIYQEYPGSNGQIYTSSSTGTKWIPTPGEYIIHDGYIMKTVDTLRTNITQGKVLSLFIHPYLDFDKISLLRDNGKINFYYSEQSNFKILLSNVFGMGYTFREF